MLSLQKDSLEMRQPLIRSVSIGLLLLTLVMTHFLLLIEQYAGVFSEQTIFRLYLWSWLPGVANCIYCIVFSRKLSWQLKLVILLTPLVQILAMVSYMFYGFGNAHWM